MLLVVLGARNLCELRILDVRCDPESGRGQGGKESSFFPDRTMNEDNPSSFGFMVLGPP